MHDPRIAFEDVAPGVEHHDFIPVVVRDVHELVVPRQDRPGTFEPPPRWIDLNVARIPDRRYLLRIWQRTQIESLLTSRHRDAKKQTEKEDSREFHGLEC